LRSTKALMCVTLTAFLWIGSVISGLAGTSVERGDILYVNVLGTPELERNTRVDADGRINLPLVGGINVAGFELEEIRRRIEETLVSQRIILDPVVLVEVSTYRPIYVGGRVKNSGTVAFEPGLTVRHALIIAGGLETGPASEALDLAQVLELLARQRATTSALIDVDSEIARLQAQLSVSNDTTSQEIEFELSEVDSNLLTELRSRNAAAAAYANTALDLVTMELDILNQQSEHQLAEQVIQRDDVARAQDLVDRGLAPINRLTELRRENSRLSRDILDNQAFAARAKQSREEIRFRMDATQTEERIAAHGALRAALKNQADLQTELEIITAHLLVAGRAPETDDRDTEIPLNVVIFRTKDGVIKEVAAQLETPLAPGDIVELRLPGRHDG
jgi:polysaccharide biosynthesis/export protein